MRITRDNLIELAQSFDDETKDYCLNDCIPTWDNKGLWTYDQPYVLKIGDDIVSVIFLNTVHTHTANIVYIQRLFTPKQYRKQGYFTELLTQVYIEHFNSGYHYMQLFYKPTVNIYKQLNFISLFTTLEGYEYCLQPMLCADMKHNNQLAILNKSCNFYNDDVTEYINSMKQKYA